MIQPLTPTFGLGQTSTASLLLARWWQMMARWNRLTKGSCFHLPPGRGQKQIQRLIICWEQTYSMQLSLNLRPEPEVQMQMIIQKHSLMAAKISVLLTIITASACCINTTISCLMFGHPIYCWDHWAISRLIGWMVSTKQSHKRISRSWCFVRGLTLTDCSCSGVNPHRLQLLWFHA